MTILCCEASSNSLQNWIAIASILSGIAAGVGIFLTYLVYRGQKILSQRQLIVPLWEYISSLNEIDPEHPITPDIIKAINTLELIAITCEGGMIDKKIIKRTFSEQFKKHFDNINSCKIIPGFNDKSGADLIKESPATLSFYKELIKSYKT